MFRIFRDGHIPSDKSVFIIAEAGVNHNGNVSAAKKLIEAAKDAGADCVKFQTFRAESLAIPDAPKALYQLATTDGTESQLQMLRKLELDFSAHEELLSYCRKLNIDFLSTPYSRDDVDFLEKLGVDSYKIASGQLVEPPFLHAVARTHKPIYLSTGMATLNEVAEAVKAIRDMGNDRIVLLQCTSNYPSRAEDANLLAIPVMAEAFGTIMGYSDHTQSHTACLVAIGLGARVIEKHLTLDRNLPGPDHKASATPEDFKRLCVAIREAEKTLGSGRKEPCEAEVVNARYMRRSLVASRKIRAGEIIREDMVAFKRPGTGLQPGMLPTLLGQVALHDIDKDELFSLSMCGDHE